MYAFEPATPAYAIFDTITEHRLRASTAPAPIRPTATRRPCPREQHSRLEAARSSPTPTAPPHGPTARTPTPATSRILPTATQPDAHNSRPFKPLPATSPSALRSDTAPNRGCAPGPDTRRHGWRAGGSASS